MNSVMRLGIPRVSIATRADPTVRRNTPSKNWWLNSAAAFSCASLGIVPTVRHADYIGSWLEVLREDNRAIVRAASQASKAADYLLGFVPGSIESASPEFVVGNSEAA